MNDEAKLRPGERYVLVTTGEYRGVFFGITSDPYGATMRFRRCRNVVYWPREQHGFVGLATIGPLRGARIGPAANMTLTGVIAEVEVTSDAWSKVEEEPWQT